MRVKSILSTKAGPDDGSSSDSVYRLAPPIMNVLCVGAPASFASRALRRAEDKSEERTAGIWAPSVPLDAG